ncbi:MAG: tonB-system energizer ExbB [Alphaproteobacteria bacterium]|nr:tonB-system energizer ExbB [Alphaproteobacteria bacterium]
MTGWLVTQGRRRSWARLAMLCGLMILSAGAVRAQDAEEAAAPLPPLTPVIELMGPNGQPIRLADGSALRVPAMVDPNGNPVFGPDGALVPRAVRFDQDDNPVIGEDGAVALLPPSEMPQIPLRDSAGVTLIGPTGEPLTAPALIGRDGRPVIGPDGTPQTLAIARDGDGVPILDTAGRTIVAAPAIPDTLPLLDADGASLLNEAGQPLLVPVARDEEGRVILGPDGRPRRAAYLTDNAGQPVLGPDGQPVLLETAIAQGLGRDLTPLSMFLQADIVVKAVMIILLLASLATWAILFAKLFFFFSLDRQTARVVANFRKSGLAGIRARGDTDVPALAMVLAAQGELAAARGASDRQALGLLKERVIAVTRAAQSQGVRDLGGGMGFLATTGAIAPFVGLFGTVWGIMNSFIGIANANTTNLAVVAPGIAEALFATGIGLFTAIPAVVFYNIFARRISAHAARLDSFGSEMLVSVSRQLDGEG